MCVYESVGESCESCVITPHALPSLCAHHPCSFPSQCPLIPHLLLITIHTHRRDAPAGTSESDIQVAARESFARSVYERAYRSMRETQPDAKEEALALLEAWKEFESDAKSRWGGFHVMMDTCAAASTTACFFINQTQNIIITHHYHLSQEC